MNGLDDLRGQAINFSEYWYPDLDKGWTLRSAIQDHIDVYVSQDTFTEVRRSFPYLVAKEFASGGGDESFFCFRTFACMGFLFYFKHDRYLSSNGTLSAMASHSRSGIPGFALHHSQASSLLSLVENFWRYIKQFTTGASFRWPLHLRI